MRSLALSALALALCASNASARGVATSSLIAAVTATCPGATSADAPVQREAGALRCGVDVVRRSYGLPPLRNSAALDRAALEKADAIRRCGFSHTPCGMSFVQTFANSGYFRGTGSVGENLAWGQSYRGTPAQTIAAWLASPGHRANLLSSRWIDSGVALERGRMFGRDGVSLWVLDFGRRR